MATTRFAALVILTLAGSLFGVFSLDHTPYYNMTSDIPTFKWDPDSKYQPPIYLGRHTIEGLMWQDCMEGCVKKHGENETHLCFLNAENIIAAESYCHITCEGKQPMEDQQKCFCTLCKHREFAHLDFCSEPDKNESITYEQCDQLACTGKATHYGKRCASNDTREELKKQEPGQAYIYKSEKDYKPCGWGKPFRERNGEFMCMEHAYLNKTSVNDPCAIKRFMLYKWKWASEQSECFCRHCKQEGGWGFCKQPGRDKSIKYYECEKLVCKDDIARNRGQFCSTDWDGSQPSGGR